MCAEYNTKLERMRALIERLTEADVAYFKNDEPIMSDWEYDQLTDERPHWNMIPVLCSPAPQLRKCPERTWRH